ncbi:MAG: CPXCG motif-containing cysteine-rich protein [Acidobacteriota bacterium]
MAFIETEHFFTCPHCSEEISVVLDLSAGAQSYIEDCEVCCRPITIHYSTNGEDVLDFSADTADD